MNNVFNIMDFGAIPDGKTDCTQAIQKALDQAGEVKGSVIVPPGEYLCNEIRLPASVDFRGYHGWGYREKGGSSLKLLNEDSQCLLNLTGAFGSKVSGLQFVGTGSGAAHGIMVCWPQYNNGAYFCDGYTTDFREDSFVIEDCQVREFGGNGIHLQCIFTFTIRSCHAILNKGHGIFINGWDAWIFNTNLSFNGGYGLYGGQSCSSITTSGNRVEWNRMGGYYFNAGRCNIIASSSFDRNMGPAIDMSSSEDSRSEFMIENNLFNRNGKGRKTPFTSPYENSQLYLKDCENTIISGNIFRIGRDDGEGGELSPNYGIVYGDLRDCIIKDNAMKNGAVISNLACIGECPNTIIKDNCTAIDLSHFE